MEKTPRGTAVGVDDPYAHAGRCDHLTDDGTCRLAVERPEADREFTRERARADFACVAAEGEGVEANGDARVGNGDGDPPVDGSAWASCPHYRCRDTDDACARCGLPEVRMAHDGDRPLLEEHHLSYPSDDTREVGHEITVSLCRWCHARVHDSWARIDDDVSPDPEAIAEREARRSKELAEAEFASAAERYRADGDD